MLLHTDLLTFSGIEAPGMSGREGRFELDNAEPDPCELDRRKRLRSQLLRRTGNGSVRARMSVHLLEREVEREVVRRLGRAESTLMLLRHCSSLDDTGHESALRERDQLSQALDLSVIEVSVDVGSRPSGTDRHVVDSSRELAAAAATILRNIRNAAECLVDDALAANVFVAEDVDEGRRADQPLVRVTDGSPATRARAEAVATELKRLGSMNAQLTDFVRDEATRRAPPRRESLGRTERGRHVSSTK